MALLLMAGGAASEAWGKITYHILSLPFTTYQRDGNRNIEGNTISAFNENVRVEALCCWDNDQVVGLPNEYKSPLIGDANYHYYAASSITQSATPQKLYGYTISTYYFYTINGETGNPEHNTANADWADDYVPVGTVLEGDVDIYVTYTYDPDDAGAIMHMDLSATRDYTGTGLLSHSQAYNIQLRDRMLVLNQNRQNRPGAVKEGFYTEEDLASDDFRWIEGGGLNGVDGYRFFKFQFGGNDPYHVTLYCAYDKPTTFRIKNKNINGLEANTTHSDYDKYIGTTTKVYKEYRGASLFSKLENGQVSGNNMWMSSEADLQWTDVWTTSDTEKKDNATIKVVPGYFKGPNDNKSTYYEMSPIFNSVAILNGKEGGYVLAASKMNVGTSNSSVNNWQPRTSDGAIQYLDYKDNGNTITLTYKKPSETPGGVIPYELKEYTFIVKTPFGSTVSAKGIWSEAYEEEAILPAHVPDSLHRKYCTFTGFYANDDPTQTITKYSDVPEDGNIYVKYSLSGMPFTAIGPSDSYTTATWYELTDAGSSQADGKKLRWDGSAKLLKNNGANAPSVAPFEKESEFAFVGDPFELRVLYRDSTERKSGKYYVGAASVVAETALTVSATASDGYKWEIPADDTDGSFELRQFGSSTTTSKFWKWTTASSGNSVAINTTSTRVKVMSLPNLTDTFNVVDLSGTIAIKGTVSLPPFTKLNGYASIPEAIRSPFLADETVTFYGSYTDRNGDGKINRLDWHNDTGGASEQAAIAETPGTNNANIYVAYTTENLSSKKISLIYYQQFNVKLNNEYIYWKKSNNKVLSEPSPVKLDSADYLWHLRGRDPYCMRIDNKGYSEQVFGNPISTTTTNMYKPEGDGRLTDGSPEAVADGMFVHVDAWEDGQKIDFVDNRPDGTRFIAMLSNNSGVYEVMAATGTTDYYRIGRVSTTGAETKIYHDSTYAHGDEQLRFELFGSTEVTYTLIDRAGKELFSVKSKNPRLALPSDYVSPLVSEYYYYKTKEEANAYRISGTVGTRITEIDQDNDAHIYVVYDESTFGFGNSYQYLLKFLDGKEYKLEDGADKLTGSKIKAMYPYFNGDGNLNIYGQPMKEEQMDGGANTRPRWVWYIESTNNDPYHVKIRSRQSISFNGTHNAYIHTQAVHFNQDANARQQRIITGGNFPGISTVPATEYMILGTRGRYKLLTTDSIAADLNGDGDTADDGENERRYVTSFEQYWKTYNMIKQCVLGLDNDNLSDPNCDDEFSDDPATYVVPADKRAELKTQLSALGINDSEDLNYVDGCSWHSYEAIANAVRWNGFNDTESGHKSKKVERLEHWFQTFDMGNGTFDIEAADIPSVLVLLDRHGWEIMRKPIPTGSGDADAPTKLAALRLYDSPMVKEYKFYSNATKLSGCHKFTLRTNSSGYRDEIKVNGKQFTSTSLATLPDYVADRDLYVTYNVKEEYDKSYNPSTHTPSKFIVLQNHQYAEDVSSTLTAQDAPSVISEAIISASFNNASFWYLQPNESIDVEMGYPGDVSALSHDNDGFDPYNIQLKNVSSGKFFTIDMTKSILSGGQYNGDYTGGTTDVTLADSTTSPIASPESYDHSTLQMTNQTFMAVQDRNGNMQIMPRFDHNTRIEAFATLEEPKVHAKAGVDDASPGEQTTFLVRPVVHEYHFIDNNGNPALHYRTGGEFYPSMPEHFKSPLAHDYKYYRTLKDNNGDGVYEMETLDSVITSSFDAAGVTYDENNKANIFIRYEYDETYDLDHERILKGRWLTMSLGDNAGNPQWVYYNGTLNDDGSGLYTDTKTADLDALKAAKQWHWKFLASPMIASSERYKAPDPYAVEIYNRDANKADADMGTAVNVDDVDRFVLLSHPDGGYALVKADDDADHFYFLNGNGMTAHGAGSPKSAKIVEDNDFSASNTEISDDARVRFDNDITHTYTYRVLTNAKHLAAHEEQIEDVAISNEYQPVIPNTIKSPLINLDDYLYFGTATEAPTNVYTLDSASQLQSMFGLYDDVIYVGYPAFDRDSTPYLVPNKRGTYGGHVIRHAESNDVTIDITGERPYNIIWYNDNMMQSTDNSAISDAESQDLTGTSQYVWYFEGSDPYDILIRKTTDKYVDGTGTLKAKASAKSFMLLEKEGWDYGVFAETGNQTYLLNFAGSPHTMSLAAADPNQFIIFALSTHQLIYHLVIDSSNVYTAIPYRTGDENTYTASDTWLATRDTTHIKGTSQRDLRSRNTGAGLHYDGEKYQLGHTYMGQTYCVDMGPVSIGDELDVPTELERANCKYYYYIDNIQTKAGTPATYQKNDATSLSEVQSDAAGLSAGAYYYYKVGSGTAYYRAYKESEVAHVDTCSSDDYDNAWQDDESLNNKYKGLKVLRLMSNPELIGSVVIVNVTYAFDTGLETNAGDGFVTSIDHLWYTFETKDGPYLAHYTNAWGLQAMEGRATRYTNDYLWSPLGDVYGFKMYNRYVYKTSNETTRVMTTEDFTEGRTLKMAVPGSTITNEDSQSKTVPEGNEIYELLATETTTPGYFLIHPVANDAGTQYYLRRNPTAGTRLNYAILSTTPTEWTYGLTEDLVNPYYERAGYAGGLNAKGKAAYEAAGNLMDKQEIVYADSNIVQYRPGYYRMHNQPGVSGISPVRYASGYLHDIEKTAGAGDTPIPMHFYSRKGVETTFEGEGGLGSGFTETAATRGVIPVPATEYDPSTIFYFNGDSVAAPTLPTSKISTQGLYVKGVQVDDNHGDAVMTATAENGTLFTIMDIGGAVFLIHDGSVPATRKYLHFSQDYKVSSVNMIYDLKYFHNSPTDDAKWCLEPANNQGLMVEMHDGGEGFFYSTFCAPYDVAVPIDAGSNNYYAYVCTAWDTEILHPKRTPASGIYAEGVFVPAATPVILRTTDNSGSMKLTLPTNVPTTPAATCIFSGVYLEQLLADEVSASDMVYAFGLPITGYTGVVYDAGSTNGNITGVVGGVQADRGVGFYINATHNKELSEISGEWLPNNRYVQHNKIFYRAGSSGARAPKKVDGVEFVPVIFGDEDEKPEEGQSQQRTGDGCAYDLLGRKVATAEDVKNGTWYQPLNPGVYIVDGKKVYIR